IPSKLTHATDLTYALSSIKTGRLVTPEKLEKKPRQQNLSKEQCPHEYVQPAA
ncbi:860_t:CDS:2, partial [Funneliformis geosporum]